MTKVIAASKARADFFSLINETATSHEPILITGKHHNAIMISQEDWNALQESLFLMSIPTMKESIIEGMNTPIDECSEDLEW